MTLPKTEQTPDDPENLPPARRRRAHRTLLPQKESEHETFLDALGHRVSPTFDFFFFSVIAAIVLSLGVWLDSPSLLVLGALLAPLMAPLVGLSLGTVTGSMRFFIRSLVGLLIASGIVFIVGFIAGLAAWTLMPSPIEIIQAYFHARLDWASFLVLTLGSVLTTLWLVRDRRSAAVASVALSYELFVPLTVAGFGLGAGLDHLWPDGLVSFHHLSGLCGAAQCSDFTGSGIPSYDDIWIHPGRGDALTWYSGGDWPLRGRCGVWGAGGATHPDPQPNANIYNDDDLFINTFSHFHSCTPDRFAYIDDHTICYPFPNADLYTQSYTDLCRCQRGRRGRSNLTSAARLGNRAGHFGTEWHNRANHRRETSRGGQCVLAECANP